MNKEEISLLRVMPTQERIRRFFPLLNARKINKPTYDYILSLEAHDPDPEGYWDGFHARLEISNDAGDSGGVIKKKSIRKKDSRSSAYTENSSSMERSSSGMVSEYSNGKITSLQQGGASGVSGLGDDRSGVDTLANRAREIGQLLMTG